LVGGRRVSNLLVRPGKQETKKRKRLMSRNTSQKRGLALGAVFALVASIFTAAPAQAAATDGANIAVRPIAGTTFTGMVYNEFPMYAQLLPGQTNSSFSTGVFMWKLEVTSGFNMDLVYASSGAAITALDENTTSTSETVAASLGAAAASQSISFNASVSPSTGLSYLTIKAASTSAQASWSAVTVVVTGWIDEVTAGSSDGVRDADEWYTTKTVTLQNMSGLSVTNNWTAPTALDVYVTASATIAGVNFLNLGNGKFFLAVSSSQAVFSGATRQQYTATLAGTTLDGRSGVISSSWAISAISENESVSFQVRYEPDGTSGAYTDGVGKAATAYAAAAPGVTSLSISAVATADIDGGGTNYDVRANKTYTIRVFAASNSTSVSKAVTVTLGGIGLVTSSRFISINGAAPVTNYPAAGFTVTTGTSGYGTFTLSTTGFVPGNTITVDADVANVDAADVTLTVATVSYTVTSDNGGLVATAPGTAVNIPFTVEDNWEEALSAPAHYLKVTRGGDAVFNYATTVSYVAIANGAAVVSFTPEPATRTGSAAVTVEVVRLDNTAYIAAGTGAVTVNVTVTSSALAFSTGLAASKAASVSYFASSVSWVTFTGKVVVPGSSVKVTGDSTLVFRKSSSVPATTAGEVTLFSDSNGNYTFDVAALRSGTKTMTLTAGSATTTSQLVVAAAGSDTGRTITWDTSTIESGKTKVITGTLTDANGNPVDTTAAGYNYAVDSGTASILVTYTGTAGIVVGTMPTETDADGKFRVSVLTAAADSGALSLTAVYMPHGTATATADRVTSVQSVAVAPAAAPEVNAVIGSFNGRWAVRVENAKGSVVSVKAGSRWVKFTSLNNNYLFSRKSVVGRTLAVSVWVDGELQNSQTITIK
jgi:hypothetical protein